MVTIIKYIIISILIMNIKCGVEPALFNARHFVRTDEWYSSIIGSVVNNPFIAIDEDVYITGLYKNAYIYDSNGLLILLPPAKEGLYAYVIKFDKDGNYKWHFYFSSDSVPSLHLSSHELYIAVSSIGPFYLYDSKNICKYKGNSANYLIHIDRDGNYQWISYNTCPIRI